MACQITQHSIGSACGNEAIKKAGTKRLGAPHGFRQEIFSSVTMLVVPISGAIMALRLHEQASFSCGLWAMVCCMCVHCVASCSFHLQSACGGPTFDQRFSPLRTADQCLIHLTCLAAAWGLSKGALVNTALNVIANLAFAAKLVRKQVAGIPGGREDGIHIILCVLLYTFFMAWECKWLHFFGVVGGYGFAAVFWLTNDALQGWGQGAFHVLLVLPIGFVMKAISL